MAPYLEPKRVLLSHQQMSEAAGSGSVSGRVTVNMTHGLAQHKPQHLFITFIKVASFVRGVCMCMCVHVCVFVCVCVCLPAPLHVNVTEKVMPCRRQQRCVTYFFPPCRRFSSAAG